MPQLIKRALKTATTPLESSVLIEVRKWLSAQADITIFRNTQGLFPLPSGRKAVVGLGLGTPDLIGSITVEGYRRIKHTFLASGSGCDSVSYSACGPYTFARALGIEVKRPGAAVKKGGDQERWHAEMTKRGWVTGVVHSVDEVEALIGRARRWEL